jgi:hypothetical protein
MRILLQFPPSISPLPCFFSPCHVLHHNLPCYEYQGPHDMPGSMCQVSCSMSHSPRTPNVYGMDLKHVWKCQGEKRVQTTDWRKKNCSSTLVLLTLATMGMCCLH